MIDGLRVQALRWELAPGVRTGKIVIAYVAPVEQKETYTLTGTGSHTLTEAQRSARSLTVLAEKVLLSPPPQYFNFLYPEPQSFWGYVQWVYRDYVSETKQLEYRRQVLLSSDWVEGERNRQLLCLIGISQELAYLRLLDLMGIGGVPQEDRAVSYENWKVETDIQFLSQVRPETALWYEVTPGYGLQITIIWIPHWEACRSGEPPVFLPSPRGTSKDEQRPGASSGGCQPVQPPPMGRRADPLSDSPAPPPIGVAGPPSPGPCPPPPDPQQRYRISGSSRGAAFSGTGFVPIGMRIIDGAGGSKILQLGAASVAGGPQNWFNVDQGPASQIVIPSLTLTPI